MDRTDINRFVSEARQSAFEEAALKAEALFSDARNAEDEIAADAGRQIATAIRALAR
jgi:hypothetical protein